MVTMMNNNAILNTPEQNFQSVSVYLWCLPNFFSPFHFFFSVPVPSSSKLITLPPRQSFSITVKSPFSCSSSSLSSSLSGCPLNLCENNEAYGVGSNGPRPMAVPPELAAGVLLRVPAERPLREG